MNFERNLSNHIVEENRRILNCLDDNVFEWGHIVGTRPFFCAGMGPPFKVAGCSPVSVHNIKQLNNSREVIISD